jgi:hypothetical protein
MMKINKIMFNGKTFELAIPVYLSDDEVQSERATALADAMFVFNIIQEQIESLMADKGEEEEKCQPKDDTSHPFADDVLMGGD